MVLIILTLLGGGVWYVGKSAQKEKYSVHTANTTAALNIKPTSQEGGDGDKDGLKDWEEALWKTDPKSADSDGDGTWDGEEVRTNRNPAVRGPNDARTDDAPQIGNTSENQDDVGNLTEAFNKAFAGTIGPRLMNGLPLSPDDLQGIKKYLPDRDKILGVAEITAANLVISEENDPASVKKYFASVYAVYEKNLSGFEAGTDLIILHQALASGKMEELAKLDPLIAGLENSFREIKEISVPRGYEEFATGGLNYLLKFSRAVEIIRGADKDPFLAMAALEARIKLPEEMKNFHHRIANLLSQKGIAFTDEQWGIVVK